MRIFHFVLIYGLVNCLSVFAFSNSKTFKTTTNKVIIKLKESQNLQSFVNLNQNLIQVSGIKYKKIIKNIILADLPVFIDRQKYIETIKSEVEWIEADLTFIGDPREGIQSLENLTNDTFFSKQYHHQIIQSKKAWDLKLGTQDIIVAVTDDGFDLNHPDLINSWYVNPNEIANNGIDDDNNGYIDDTIGWDFANNDNNVIFSYLNGAHGTHVAGILAAEINNNIGVAGMSPHIKVMPLKFYDSKTSWTASVVAETYKYAIDNGARIISTSYNIDTLASTNIYKEIIKYANEKGVLVFNSAGNNNVENSKRTTIDGVNLVANTISTKFKRRRDRKSNSSNYGTLVDISAPGSPIYSTGRRGTYLNMSGTSMSTPVAAGAAAYILSIFPNYNNFEVMDILSLSSDNIDKKNRKYINKLGFGRVNLYNIASQNLREPNISFVHFNNTTHILNIKINAIISPDLLNQNQKIFSVYHNNIKLEKENFILQSGYQIASNFVNFKLNNAEHGDYKLIVSHKYFATPLGYKLSKDIVLKFFVL